jgi:Tat protein translocase TatB subunit
MSSIGLGEILLILVVTVIVLGPKQLPRALQKFNYFIKRIKQIKTAVLRELNHE